MPIEGSIGTVGADNGSGIGSDTAFELQENGTRRQTVRFGFDAGLPGTSAEYDPSAFGSQAAIRAYTLATLSIWGLSGTNATAALATRATNGGLTLTTAGASGDQMILSPLTINSVPQNALGGTVWRPDSGLSYKALITTGSSIADVRICAGMTLIANAEDHDTGATITDDDYVMFVFDSTHASDATLWHACAGNNGTDENSRCSDRIGSSVVRSSNTTLLEIVVKGNYRPTFLLDGAEVAQLSPLKTGSVSLIPFFSIQALAGSAKSITLLNGECGINVS